jgi:hypothetical protein
LVPQYQDPETEVIDTFGIAPIKIAPLDMKSGAIFYVKASSYAYECQVGMKSVSVYADNDTSQAQDDIPNDRGIIFFVPLID